jgi:hypothetical protein
MERRPACVKRFEKYLEEYDDISLDLKEDLVSDFNRFEEIYREKPVHLKRTNFPNMRFILTRLLKRREIPRQLHVMSNKKTQKNYERTLDEIFVEMGVPKLEDQS